MSETADLWARTFAQGGVINNVNDVLDRTPMGNPSRAIGETIRGLNHRNLANSIPINRDYYGLAFFTRPDMRMTTENLSRERIFSPLLTKRAESLPRAIRAMLDNRHNDHGDRSYPCPLVDPKQIFIPLLTNQLISMSGWQDVELPTFTSEKGVYGEEISYADGVASIYRTYDITANFRNIPGDPITSLFLYWIHYAALVYEGKLIPYTNNIVENTIDYQTRIWRIVLDSTKRWVQKIGCTGASFPIGISIGQNYNYEIDQPINRNDQISVQFRSIGAEYVDDILISDFNKTVVLGNADMADAARQNAGMMKIPYEYIYLFNHMGYPRIDPTTYELEWWIYTAEFQARLGGGPDAGDADTGWDESQDIILDDSDDVVPYDASQDAGYNGT